MYYIVEKMYARDRQEDSEFLLADSQESEKQEPRSRSAKAHQSRGPIWLLFLLHPVSLMVGCWLGIRLSFDHHKPCIGQESQTSPLLANISISYDTVQFNGSFLKNSIFRQDASPEVDEAWHSLGVRYRSFVLRPEEALKAGFRADQVKVNEKYGGGFLAYSEGLHHLHCLNLLRQSLYFNYDYYHVAGGELFGGSDNELRRHVSHCLGILRQQLMCTADIEVFGMIWINETAPVAFWDFDTNHVCKNFDAIRQWAEERQISEDTPEDYLQPPEPGDKIYEDYP